ncbi:MAG: response regulator [bacterium]|nr:response regulator [bacterium]
MLGYVLARSILVPVKHLLHGVQTITSGDLSHELTVRSQDELGTLALAFNSMAQQLKGLFDTLEQRVEAATRELQSTLAYMTTIIDNMADGLLATDPDGRITRANPALKLMLGIEEEAREGRNSKDVFDEDVCELVEATSSGKEQYASTEVQMTSERIGKAVATAICKESNLSDTMQECIGAVILVRDITREKEVDQMKTDFISTVSHELRTPLTSVLGFTKIIKKRFEKVLLPQLEGVTEKKTARAVGQVQDNLDIIIAEGERLTKLINDVLDVAKMEAGKIDWKMEKVPVTEIIERATIATSALFEKKGLAQIKDIPDDVPMITGDRDRLIQVAINLISNAVKFTDEGSVTCRVRREKNDLIVSVIDTGDGISEADQPKVFEKFKQVGDTLTDRPTGTGLGLPICKQIVEHHGGRIWVESRLEQGSTFSFSLPILLETTLLQRKSGKVLFLEHARQKAVLEESEGPKSILVVDDEAAIRKLLRQELEPEGYRVLEAKNGAEAIEMAWKEPPFAIVLDVLMPEMNGFEVASVLKSDPLTMDVPIVILSLLEGREMGYHFGIDCYLPKPIDIRKLLRKITDLSSQLPDRMNLLIGGDEQSTVAPLNELLSAHFHVLGVTSFPEFQKLVLTEVPALCIIDEAFAEAHKEVYRLHEEKSLERVFLVILGEEKADGSHSS